ncbi:TetR/AcrR family transcriptional regulator [Sphingomonas sp.]|uniref:TetR/AcrR family transcriptional regulator n=1 Tax=Sphingomonas sp. TaxID=28214 RepID=UPI000DB64A15|nr:TetR/AcrR family transcriptional regulator [Sphingomonas sp.]PZU09709.1 MAG: TetR family transcriptional regulator [Sphingomonas sp.]
MQKSDASAEGCAAVRRGRPRAFDREKALATAMHLFWQKGYSATSICDLTSAMGIGSPSLYAAFGSKEALYSEALKHYASTHEAIAWGRFFAAETAREAVAAFLHDTAGGLVEAANGCMVTLSAVGGEGHAELGALVASARHATLVRLKDRLEQAQAAGEIGRSVDIHGLARFVQTMQNGMSLLARDGASLDELKAVADTAMLGWDARIAETSSA